MVGRDRGEEWRGVGIVVRGGDAASWCGSDRIINLSLKLLIHCYIASLPAAHQSQPPSSGQRSAAQQDKIVAGVENLVNNPLAGFGGQDGHQKRDCNQEHP